MQLLCILMKILYKNIKKKKKMNSRICVLRNFKIFNQNYYTSNVEELHLHKNPGFSNK